MNGCFSVIRWVLVVYGIPTSAVAVMKHIPNTYSHEKTAYVPDPAPGGLPFKKSDRADCGKH
jgi:hypothetical protein